MTPRRTPDSPPDAPETLRCRTTADFLAALPLLVGYTAEDSLFVAPFTGNRTDLAFRIDLPPDESPQTSLHYFDELCRVLRALSAGGPPPEIAAAICTSQTFAECDGAPWRRFAGRLRRRLEREHFGVRELCCLAPDGWVGFLDPSAPRAGRPLREIAESPIARLGANDRPVPGLAQLGALPDPDPGFAERVAAELTRIPEFPRRRALPRSEFDRRSPGDLAWIARTVAVGRALRGPGPLGAEETAELIRHAACPDRWLVLALGLLTRPEFPLELAEELGPARFVGMPAEIDLPTAMRENDGRSIRSLLSHLGHGFTEQRRIPPTRALLLAALAACPEPLRPGLYALSAWTWWLGGSQTVAARHVDDALAIDAEHGIALAVRRLTAAPLIPFGGGHRRVPPDPPGARTEDGIPLELLDDLGVDRWGDGRGDDRAGGPPGPGTAGRGATRPDADGQRASAA